MQVVARDKEELVSPTTISVDTLLTRCHVLLNELEQFQTFLIEHKKKHTVELRQFRNAVGSELKSLEKLAEADPTAERTIHTLRSSNFPFYSAVWAAAKSSTGLVTFNKRFYWDTPLARSSERAGKPKKRSALVDIVAQDGEEWIKVSTITENRLLFEKAKAGWEGASSSGSEADENGTIINGIESVGKAMNEDEEDKVEILKMAYDLQKASKVTRIRYRHPKIKFVLPKISEGHIPEIDTILAEIRATGATVQCASDLSAPESLHYPSHINGSTDSTLSLSFSHLLIDPFSTFTPTLNIDCTILLALVSDLSNAHVVPEPRYHRAIRRQIDLEEKEQLLPSSLWPAMGNHELVCTFEAAKRMREIVGLIGTDTEKVRAELLLGEGENGEGKTAQELTEAFDGTSSYEVPKEWNLPIKVVQAEVDMADLPPVAGKVAEHLTAINRSVFLFGWARRLTTISSNRTVAKTIESLIEGEKGEEVVGPDIWLCATARSLVGKEKGRRE